MMVTRPDIANQRLYNQHLAGMPSDKPRDVVAWLGAVQAQDFAGAKWALGLRSQSMTDTKVEQAFAEGAFLRTHVMRPTWHFVMPADIRWLLELTAPRVNAFNAFMYRKLELDDDTFKRSSAALTKALQGGKQLTRRQLATVLGQAGIAVGDTVRLSLLMMRAELDAVICSGARHGKQFTYALLEERAPQAHRLTRDEALAELTKRYFTSHGPAMIKDFAWWSGLMVADVKAGLELAKPYVVQEKIDGHPYWRASSTPAITNTAPRALLLPPYDEYTIAYKNHSAILEPMYVDVAKSSLYGGVTVIDGQVIGNWKRTFRNGAAVIELAPYRPLTLDERDALAVAAQRYGEFLEMPVEVMQATAR